MGQASRPLYTLRFDHSKAHGQRVMCSLLFRSICREQCCRCQAAEARLVCKIRRKTVVQNPKRTAPLRRTSGASVEAGRVSMHRLRSRRPACGPPQRWTRAGSPEPKQQNAKSGDALPEVPHEETQSPVEGGARVCLQDWMVTEVWLGKMSTLPINAAQAQREGSVYTVLLEILWQIK
jgi:hypothetical protein